MSITSNTRSHTHPNHQSAQHTKTPRKQKKKTPKPENTRHDLPWHVRRPAKNKTDDSRTDHKQAGCLSNTQCAPCLAVLRPLYVNSKSSSSFPFFWKTLQNTHGFENESTVPPHVGGVAPAPRAPIWDANPVRHVSSTQGSRLERALWRVRMLRGGSHKNRIVGHSGRSTMRGKAAEQEHAEQFGTCSTPVPPLAHLGTSPKLGCCQATGRTLLCVTKLRAVPGSSTAAKLGGSGLPSKWRRTCWEATSGWRAPTGYDQVWPDQVWPNPSLARPSLAKTKFGQDQVWPNQVWPKPNLAKPLCCCCCVCVLLLLLLLLLLLMWCCCVVLCCVVLCCVVLCCVVLCCVVLCCVVLCCVVLCCVVLCCVVLCCVVLCCVVLCCVVLCCVVLCCVVLCCVVLCCVVLCCVVLCCVVLCCVVLCCVVLCCVVLCCVVLCCVVLCCVVLCCVVLCCVVLCCVVLCCVVLCCVVLCVVCCPNPKPWTLNPKPKRPKP